MLDLAVPRDVDPGVAELPGVTLVDIERLGDRAPLGDPPPTRYGRPRQSSTRSWRRSGSWLRGADVAPTVAALRARADEVVGAELRRLRQRRPDLTDEQRADVAHAVHRVVQRLLHLPSVRVKQLAAEPGGEAYAKALRDLFDLEIPQDLTDIDATAASRIDPDPPGGDPVSLRLGTRGSAAGDDPVRPGGRGASAGDRTRRGAGRDHHGR